MISKRALSFLLTIVIMFSMLAFVGIAAQDSETDTGQTASQRKEARNSRIEALKQARDIKLDATRERVITQKCEVAQERISNLSVRVEKFGEKRLEIYGLFYEKLQTFETRLENAGVDVTDLSQTLVTYNGLVEELAEQIADYVQALEDMSAIDCVADPTGFQSILDEAKEIMSELRTQIKLVHDYLRDEVRQAFTAVMQSFEGTSEDETSEEGEQ